MAVSDSSLNKLIPPEIKNDTFYQAIQEIASTEDVQNILEIGSSSGGGSTEAFVQGIKNNPNQPTLFCMEVSKPRFSELERTYAEEPFVKAYNVSSISIDKFPSQENVINFYQNNRTNLNHYPLEAVLGWLEQDLEYIKQSGVETNGIRKIKKENNIDFFDVVLIDGSEFTGIAELEEIYGAKYIFLDDINTFKNNQNYFYLCKDNDYTLIAEDSKLRNGYAIFKKNTVKPRSYNTIHSVVESIEGFMIQGQEEYLFNKVSSLSNDAIIVEIGSFKGRSTLAMAYACIGTNRKIYSIDTWDGNDSDFSERNFFEIWEKNVRDNKVMDYVVPLQGYSYDILSRWNELFPNQKIDFIFIDGSHQYLDVLSDFELSFPLVKEEGWIAFHDVVHTWPGPERIWHNIAKLYLVNHEYSSTLACGQKNSNLRFSHTSLKLPIHFFTIVLNGDPFIRYHIDVFKQLSCQWHWHIIEGVADLKHDTAWSVKNGGLVTDEIHTNGRSNDGTSEYIDELAKLYPDNITVYRKPEGIFWDGKREMVNAPLDNIQEECLLWQVDVDELWTVEQINTARHLFITHPEKTAAFYWCWYFVGEDLIISTRNCYAQNPKQDWLRTWRFKPGAFWAAHEPPILVESVGKDRQQNIAAVNPFLHPETEKKGLIFQHFAYAISKQLKFKELYYGYKNAVNQWNTLQSETNFPVYLRQYFPWVKDNTLVDKAQSFGVTPIAQKDLANNWKFMQPDVVKAERRLPTIVVDGVFFQLYKTGIARVWRSLLEEWANQDFSQHIVVLDRIGTAPKIPGIWYRTMSAYDYNKTEEDRKLLQQACDEEGADLFISTYYTTPISTPSVFMAYDMIPEALGGNLNEPMWREKHHAIRHASAYLSISENTASDLVKFFSGITLEDVTVAHCGVARHFSPTSQTEINKFKLKYGITKPYFLLVGAGSNYKNAGLFFKAFAQLHSKQGFDIICTGSGYTLGNEYREFTSGCVVHPLQLSDEELRVAYSGATALVYPSLYEGFGMPVAEAMACGCPVITCPNASLPEVGGEAVIYVNHNDVEELANALCEVQKPKIRKKLITAGIEQAKKFSWEKMADTVSSALINATLQRLNLREINWIVFPDWSQPEETLALELTQVLKAVMTHPDKDQITLLVDNSNISDEEADLALSSVVMNLMMEEELEVEEGAEIALIGELSEIQWSALLPRLQGRIILACDNLKTIAKVKAENLAIIKIR